MSFVCPLSCLSFLQLSLSILQDLFVRQDVLQHPLVYLDFPRSLKAIPSHQPTWKCTDPSRSTTFLLERAFLHFHVSWWEGRGSIFNKIRESGC